MRESRGLSLFLAEGLGWILFLQSETYNVEVLDMVMAGRKKGIEFLGTGSQKSKGFTP